MLSYYKLFNNTCCEQTQDIVVNKIILSTFNIIIRIVNAKGRKPSNEDSYDFDVPNEFDSEVEDNLSTFSEESTEKEYWDSDIETGNFVNDHDDRDTEDDKSLNQLLFVSIVFMFLF